MAVDTEAIVRKIAENFIVEIAQGKWDEVTDNQD